MRIGIDARFYSSTATGIGRYVYELVKHLLAIDQKNEYVLFLNEPEFSTFTPPRPGVKKINARSPHYSFREQFHFWRLLESEQLDLMHFTHFNAPLLYRKPSVVTIHDLTLHLYPGKKMGDIFHRLAYNITVRSIIKRSKHIIAVSKNTKKDVVEYLKIDPQKISVVHLGVSTMFHHVHDKKIIDEFREKMALHRPYLLYTGVWRSHKNLVNLIRAFALLRKRGQFDGQLVITGKEDPWYPEVKEAVAEHKLEGEVRFTGLVSDEDLVLIYNAASIYVFPSLYEGFGLPALEAFACGIPVCAADTSSLPEVCGEGNAVFFNPKDPDDIADKIASVYTNPTLQKELIERGKKRILDFSWHTVAEKTLEIYRI